MTNPKLVRAAYASFEHTAEKMLEIADRLGAKVKCDDGEEH